MTKGKHAWFKGSVDKELVQQIKATSKPTIRELLETRRISHAPVMLVRADDLLAERVEAVLKLAEKRHAAEAYDVALRDVLRALNGERP